MTARRLLLAALAAWLGTALHAAGPTPRTIAALDPALTAGRGATVPFDEYEAENAVTNGERIGPDRRFTTLAAEASGRQAVRLAGAGRFVEFTLARAANALTVRYALPDGADGRGVDATLGVYVGGARVAALTTTSRYGWFYGAYPFTNRPSDGRPHHFYDHARLLLPRTLPAGTRVRLQVGTGDRAPWYAVDLADFEFAPPPLAVPAGALSVLAFGADPSGASDATPALRRAVDAARRRGATLWIPPGIFRVEGHIVLDRVTLQGAGLWHTTLRGRGLGLYGRPASSGGSTRVALRDFALIGEVTDRIDDVQVNGVGGAMGGGSVIERLWLQHHKVGLWFDGPMRGLRVADLRILDMTADGLNFHQGVSDAVVENCFVRGTGDDGLAAWSHRQADHDIAFRRNTVIAPVLANGIAIYGGRDIAVAGNLVADTLTEGGGLHIGNRFDAVPVAGAITLSDNMLVRSGSIDPRWRFGVGALWFYALDARMKGAIRVRDTTIVAPTAEAVLFLGKPITNVAIDGMRITDATTPEVALRSPGEGSMTRTGVEGHAVLGVRACRGDFRLRVSPLRTVSVASGC